MRFCRGKRWNLRLRFPLFMVTSGIYDDEASPPTIADITDRLPSKRLNKRYTIGCPC
jgi:hypothetical protein